MQNKGTKWLEEETKFLLENYRKSSNKELATLMGRTEKTIYRKACKLGLCSTDKDIKYKVDHIDKVFGKLTVVSFDDFRSSKNKKRRYTYWNCICECGGKISVPSNALLNGNTKSCGCLKNVLEKGEASCNRLFSIYKESALIRKYEFCLTKEKFIEITQKNCYYCGTPPKQKIFPAGFNGEYIYNGIDRKVNEIGYTDQNCVPCCILCNRAKSTVSPSEFEEWLNTLVEHRNAQTI